MVSIEPWVCGRYCNFYKPGQERLRCGTYDFLERNLSSGELRGIASSAPANFDLSMDPQIKDLVCARCDFLADGCDFRLGKDSPPCGGYLIIEYLLKSAKPCLKA